MAKKSTKIPTTAKQAEKKGYVRATAGCGKKEKKKWAMIKHKGNWSFDKVSSATVNGSHTICYYNPNTGNWDDCHTV